MLAPTYRSGTMVSRVRALALPAVATLLAAAAPSGCGSGKSGAATGAPLLDAGNGTATPFDASTVRPPIDGGGIIILPDAGPAVDADGTGVDANFVPPNFVVTEQGGYALGPALGDAGDASFIASEGSSCSFVLGVVRDELSFGRQDGGHPDFEHYTGKGPTTGLVKASLGADHKPVYAGECDSSGANNPPCPWGQEMTDAGTFVSWYNTTPDVNLPYLVYLKFVPKPAGDSGVADSGVYTFQSNEFFPLDDAGFGNTPGFNHNFSFTTEVHLKFIYKGGETFSFSGDDDLWIFINGQLVIDLGGCHTPANGNVELDALGLTTGNEYALDIFNAERHSTGSNFEVDTDLSLSNCGTVYPPPNPQ